MLYTVIMEYRGGTYISQVDGDSVVEALRKCASALDPAGIQGRGQARKKDLIDDIGSSLSYGDEPVPLQGLSNVWCTSALTSGGIMQINLVATQQ
jgi:hypothetical protein